MEDGINDIAIKTAITVDNVESWLAQESKYSKIIRGAQNQVYRFLLIEAFQSIEGIVSLPWILSRPPILR